MLDFTFDAAYYWPEKKSQYGKWEYEKLPSGHEYYLYIPEKFKNDRENENAKLHSTKVKFYADEKFSDRGKFQTWQAKIAAASIL